MMRLQVVGVVTFDQSPSTTNIVSHLTGCLQFERCPNSPGVRQRYNPDDDMLHLWTCPEPSYDLSLRNMLLVFLTSHHVFWILPSRLDLESLRLLKHLQQLRLSLDGSYAPPSLSFVVPSPWMTKDNLSLRYRAQTENTIRALITPICSNPPLFQVPIQKPALMVPSFSEPSTARLLELQMKRFRQAAQNAASSGRSRWPSIPSKLDDWRTYTEQLQRLLQSVVPAIVSPVANTLRLLWDELLPGFAEVAIRLYSENCTNGMYGDDIHQLNARKSLDHIRPNLPSHVYNQLEPVLLSQLEAIWTRSGRRKCNAISITGRPCILSLHLTENADAVPPSFGDVPRKRHSSGFQTLCSCNCGATQITLFDPFDLNEAESDAFSLACCQTSVLESPFASWHIHKIDKKMEFGPWFQWCVAQENFVLVTFELECGSGHRFFHNFRDPVAKFLSSSAPCLVRESFPPTDVPVILKCHQCRIMSSNAPARLRRIYVDTTNTSWSVIFRPEVFARCKRPECHLKTVEERNEVDEFIDLNIARDICYRIPAKTVLAISVPFGFPSSLGSNRAYRADPYHEIVIGRGILFKKDPISDIKPE